MEDTVGFVCMKYWGPRTIIKVY